MPIIGILSESTRDENLGEALRGTEEAHKGMEGKFTSRSQAVLPHCKLTASQRATPLCPAQQYSTARHGCKHACWVWEKESAAGNQNTILTGRDRTAPEN